MGAKQPADQQRHQHLRQIQAAGQNQPAAVAVIARSRGDDLTRKQQREAQQQHRIDQRIQREGGECGQGGRECHTSSRREIE